MSEFEAYLDKSTTPGPDRKITGAVFIVVNKDGTTYTKSSGTKSIDPASPLSSTPTSPSDTFWLASCTKLITTIAALQVIEKGLIGLDDDVSTALHEYSNPDILKGFDDSGAPIFEKAKTKITLRHLLTHTSGIGYWNFQEPLQKLAATLSEDKKPDPRVFAGHQPPLLFEPGTSWTYGAGFDNVALLIERLTGTKANDFITTHIFAPLGITQASFRLLDRPDILNARVDMTLRTPDGSLTPSPTRHWPDDTIDDLGGAGLWASPAAYAKVLSAILRNDGAILQPATMDLLFQPCLGPASLAALRALFDLDPRQIGVLTTYLPASSLPNHGVAGLVFEADVVGDALGNGGKRRRKGSLAWSGMPNHFWFVDREAGVACLMTSQLLPPGDFESNDLFRRFEESVYKGEIPGAKL